MVAFGTDGVRGRAYDELTLADASRIGAAVAEVFGSPAVAVGRDTRESGPDFVRALGGGITAKGGRVSDLGVVPTPAVAHYAAAHRVPGVVVSASHNPYHDNGLKVLAPGGVKLDDPTEARLEAAIGVQDDNSEAAADIDIVDSAREYTDHVIDSIGAGGLRGLRIVVDAANGAASAFARPVFDGLGAEVEFIHDRPDGRNINDRCGSTDPDDLRAMVPRVGADLGIALDGDADRMVAVAADGSLVDGDHVIAICAIDRHERGLLVDDTVVVTVMTNLGFRLAMAERGIAVHETPVGDRHVLAALEANDWSLGGEQSGHVIFRDLATTGDGLLTAVQLLDAVVRSGRPLGDLAAGAMTRLPQVLENVRVEGDAAAAAAVLEPRVAELQAELGDRGRILVRASGTEPLVRVMVEAATDEEARQLAARVVSWI